MSAPSLIRQFFKTSRLAEFCSQKELVNQTGHAVEDWPLVILKELVDNALDAAEEASVAPVIAIDVSNDGIVVTDNGPGIAPDAVSNILDFASRTSSREAYASPTRGAQGNALKPILAMPFALIGDRGETTIESRGVAHRITFSIDPIRQEPRIIRVCEDSLVKIGTRVAVSWPNSACSILAAVQARFLRIASDYAWVNPHLTLALAWTRASSCGARWTIPATDPAWHKWSPSDPTSPHWYDKSRLSRLMANNIARAEDNGLPCRTVWDFVRGFRGLSSTAKARDICEAAGASRMSLAEFYGDGNDDRVAALLREMRNQSRQIKPRDLGLIGEVSLRAKFEDAGVAPASFSYKRAEIELNGAPYLVEVATKRTTSAGSLPASTGLRPSAIHSGVSTAIREAWVRF